MRHDGKRRGETRYKVEVITRDNRTVPGAQGNARYCHYRRQWKPKYRLNRERVTVTPISPRKSSTKEGEGIEEKRSLEDVKGRYIWRRKRSG